MQKDIHPYYKEIAVECSCGNQFKTRSTIEKPILKIEICGSCHPFYTGTQRLVDSQSRVSKFEDRFKRLKKNNQQEETR